MTRIICNLRCPCLVAVGLALLVGLACCGGGLREASSGGPEASSSGGSGAVRVRYSATSSTDGVEQHQKTEVITDGDRRFRVTFTANDSEGPPGGSRIVWDGKTLLEYFPDGDPPYSRTENPPQEQRPIYVFKPGTDEFSTVCPTAKRVGTDTIVGRVAVHYACSRVQNADGTEQRAHQLWLDEATGLLLRDSGDGFTTVATEFSPNPPIDESTFSTKVPEGAEDAAPSPG
jgi:outer membrane lipoprotein-sorting protein